MRRDAGQQLALDTAAEPDQVRHLAVPVEYRLVVHEPPGLYAVANADQLRAARRTDHGQPVTAIRPQARIGGNHSARGRRVLARVVNERGRDHGAGLEVGEDGGRLVLVELADARSNERLLVGGVRHAHPRREGILRVAGSCAGSRSGCPGSASVCYVACHLSATKKLVRQSSMPRNRSPIRMRNRLGHVARFAGLEGPVPGKLEEPEVVGADDIGPAVLAGAEAELQGVILRREGELVAEPRGHHRRAARAFMRPGLIVRVHLPGAEVQLVAPAKADERHPLQPR